MPDAANVDDLIFRPMQSVESDLRLFRDCFAANGSPRSLELLHWQYLEAPAGPLFVDLAVAPDSAKLAAIYAVFPVAMRANGRPALGVQSLDTLTDEKYRGKGLFLRMARALYARCAQSGVQLVYGFPNGNSAHGLFERLEWHCIDPMPLMLRPLRFGYVLRKIGASRLAGQFDIPITLGRTPRISAGAELRTLTTITPEFDDVWQAFALSIGFAVERSANYLSWRLRRPGANYECIGLFVNRRAIGLAVIGTSCTADGQLVGKIMEFFFDPAYVRAGHVLATEAVRRLYRKGCGAVWAWSFKHSPNHAALRRVGFFNVPASRHGTELHAGARAFSRLPSIGERSQWYVSMLDSDTD